MILIALFILAASFLARPKTVHKLATMIKKDRPEIKL